MAGIVCDDLDCIMFEGSIISEVWCEGSLLYQYDSTAPALTVTAPTGTASGSPTYYTSGTTYRVQGTVTDADSGVAAVYVNGSAATLSGNTWYKDITVAANTTVTVQVYAVDKAGNQSATITRYVRYDSAAPSLAVTAPTGTSASAPTYTTGASYTVSGTVSDASGIKSVTVNGAAASVSSGKWSKTITLTKDTATKITVVATDNAGRTATLTRYVFYESANPTVAVTAPTGTASSSPTYVQSDAALSYKVYGTASAKSGIKSVTVNGAAASGTTSWSYTSSRATNTTHTITIVVTSKAGRTTTVNRYLRVEAYYQQAARVAGATVQASLDATLKSSTVCTKLAGNSTACSIMASNYKSNLTSYIDSNFSDGLNLLNYKCGAKCYIYHSGNQCSNITGGWTNWSNGMEGVTPSFLSNRILITILVNSKNNYACGGAITKSSIALSNYRTLSTVIQSANDGAGWTAPAYKMQTGIASSYSTSIDTGTGAAGYAAYVEANNGSLYPSKTTLSCSISSLSKGYGIFGLNQGYGSNNNMYHTWHSIALIP